MGKSRTHLPIALYIAEEVIAERLAPTFSPDAIRAICRISQVTLVQDALDGRIVIHCSNMVVHVIIVKPHAGSRAEYFLFRCASAEGHDGAAILLSHGAFRIKAMAHVVDANRIGDLYLPGFGIHFYLYEVGLPAHKIVCLVRLPV